MMVFREEVEGVFKKLLVVEVILTLQGIFVCDLCFVVYVLWYQSVLRWVTLCAPRCSLSGGYFGVNRWRSLLCCLGRGGCVVCLRILHSSCKDKKQR